MTSREFESSFWSHYIMLEKEFMLTTNYVKIDVDNFNTFSDAYVKLLLQIGSEVDIVAKEACKLIDWKFTGESMNKYRQVLATDNNFCNTKVRLINYNITLNPWDEIKTTNTTNIPITWWNIYNKIKHYRVKEITVNGIKKPSYKFANLENVLNALSGLYLLLLHSYATLLRMEKQSLSVMLPGSRLFKLEGTMWKNVSFPFDISFYVDNGCLYMKSSNIQY